MLRYSKVPNWTPILKSSKVSTRTISNITRSLLTTQRQSTPLRSVTLSPKTWSVTATRGYAEKIVVVPQIADSINEGTLKQWSKNVGDFVKQDEEVATIETDKVDIPVNSPASGYILEQFAAEEDTIAVGQNLFKLDLQDAPKEGEQQEAPKSEEPAKQDAPKEEAPKEESKPAPTSAPKETKPAQQPKKETSQPQSHKPNASVTGTEPPKKVESNPQEALYGRTETRVKMNRMRTRIAERLKEAQNTAASLTTFNEVDMSYLMELRKTYKDKVLEKHGVKLGFMSAFVKASAIALQEIPAVNASVEGPNGGDTVVYRDYVDVSVAVATPKGLVTPVLRNAQQMSFVDVERNIAALSKKARDNKITIEDLTGGTFTISNGGVFGSLMGTPIINLPQSAILGMHAIKERPIVVNGKVEVRPMMYLALTYDHRIIDGREAVTFLVRVKEILEDPRRLLLDV